MGTSNKRKSVIEQSIAGITEALEQSLFAEEINHLPGLFQSLDPRVKLLSVLMWIVSVNLSHHLSLIVLIYLLTLALSWFSKIPAKIFIKRVWFALPFFTGLMILPALFFVPGPVAIQFPLGIMITKTGINTALFLLLRVSTSLTLTLLLILTTPWNVLLSAFSVLQLPDVFILILGMTYRYIFLLLHLANDMFLSRRSRVVGRLNSSEERRVMAATGATLLSKSLNMSSEVYLAMQSRGFRGRAVTLKPFRMKRWDWAWGAILLTMGVAFIILSFTPGLI